MKTNILKLKVVFNSEIVDEIIGKQVHEQWETDVEHDIDYLVRYYEGLNGKVYYNFNGSEFVHELDSSNGCYFNGPAEKQKGGKHFRKSERKHRVSLMTSYIWAPDGLFGCNRRFRRRMYPSPTELQMANEYLPF